MSDVAEQQETSLETMQSILERQKRAYLAEGEVSFATRFDRLERAIQVVRANEQRFICLLYTSPSPRDGLLSRMPSSA